MFPGDRYTPGPLPLLEISHPEVPQPGVEGVDPVRAEDPILVTALPPLVSPLPCPPELDTSPSPDGVEDPQVAEETRRTRCLLEATWAYISNILPSQALPRGQDSVSPPFEADVGSTWAQETFGPFSVLRIRRIGCGCTRVHLLRDRRPQLSRVPPRPEIL